jgi:hypothetical protein
MALFIWLIIRLIQLVFSAGTVFFSHKKSANSVFQPAYNSSRTTPILALPTALHGSEWMDQHWNLVCSTQQRMDQNQTGT